LRGRAREGKLTHDKEPARVTAPSPLTPLIPRAVLFGNPERANVQISPDGAHLAWLAPKDGVLNVWVAPAHDLGRARPVTADTTRPVSRYLWSHDSRRLLYLQDRAGDENFHLFAVELASGAVTDLLPIDGARVDIQATSRARPATVVVAINDRDPQLFDLWQLDLDSGDRSLLLHNDGGYVGFALDHDLRVRYVEQMAPDGSRVLLAPDGDAGEGPPAWREYDRVGPEDALTTEIVTFDEPGTAYYAYDSRGRETRALFKVDAATRARTLVIGDERSDVGALLVHPTSHAVQAVQLNYDLPRWAVIDEQLAPDLAALAALEDGFPRITSRTLDDRTWIVAFESDHRSARYHRWDRDSRQGTFLFSVQPALEEQPLVPMKAVVIRARDGLDLVSYLTLPRGAAGPAPMVLLVHGGPWARDEWGWNPLHQLLANRGYAVLSVNFRASTGFGKTFLNAGNRQWGQAMQDDLLDAVAWAIEEGIAARDRICIMGGSYGGYATLAGMTMTPDVFACGVDIVGPSNLITLLETIPPYWVPALALFHDRMGDPRSPEGKQALIDASPLTHADQIRRPLLIAQGANDPRVKKSESDQIVAAMQAKGIPVGYVLFPDEGHGFARPENNLAFIAVTEAFLSVHLGGAYQPLTEEELAASSMQVVAGDAWLPGLPVRPQ
jgi:dipeptidyl aminopeptidase/acylaminoacyl peptidase